MHLEYEEETRGVQSDIGLGLFLSGESTRQTRPGEHGRRAIRLLCY